MIDLENIKSKAITILQKLIETPSLSKEEHNTAQIIADSLSKENINHHRENNNVWAVSKNFNPEKPTILLNSHHDTVKPNASYTRDPYEGKIEGDILYGLGSNDAGGPLVALLATFVYFNTIENLPFNLVFAATAEEEISGKNGIESILKHLPIIDLAIVGEPTLMQMAVAEKGLMVLDCVAKGVAGHAAREEGENAIYAALDDIYWFKNYVFDKESQVLGPIKMSVTLINAGTQHNVVPDSCSFVVDVRLTDVYTMEQTLDIIKSHIKAEVTPRSMRLKPSGIALDHAIVEKAKTLGMKTYGSPTLSDQALIPYPSVKIGPGDSARSHTADEYIYVSEIIKGIDGYITLLKDLKL
jgi:acetylornithine deacetylase